MGLRAEHLDLVVLWPLGRRFMFVFGEGGCRFHEGQKHRPSSNASHPGNPRIVGSTGTTSTTGQRKHDSIGT